jgi:hypothetical protein
MPMWWVGGWWWWVVVVVVVGEFSFLNLDGWRSISLSGCKDASPPLINHTLKRDGVSMWQAIISNGPSPRTRIVIDVEKPPSKGQAGAGGGAGGCSSHPKYCIPQQVCLF